MSSSESDNPIDFAPEELSALDAVQASAIFEQGREAVVFALLELAEQRVEITNQLAEVRSLSAILLTSSGMIPVNQKPPIKTLKKKVGAKANHVGNNQEMGVGNNKCQSVYELIAQISNPPVGVMQGKMPPPTPSTDI